MRHGRLVLLLAVTACGHSSPTRFWTLDALPPPARPSPATAIAPLRIDAVHVPQGLDRVELVAQTAANRVTVRDFDHWSAPLGDLIKRTLTQDLQARLPAGSVILPATPKPPGTRGLAIDILTLRPTGGAWLLEVGWTLTDPVAPGRTRRDQLRLTSSAHPSDAAGEAAALSELSGTLADRISTALMP